MFKTLFETPLWILDKELPEGAYDWALSTEKNITGRKRSNFGGYQSEIMEIKTLPYFDHILSMISFLPRIRLSGYWVNINRRGNVNMVHTHPDSDLTFVWYITDNDNKLVLENPLYHTRYSLYNANKMHTAFRPDGKKGSLIIFPSDIPHWVDSHDLDTPRISISFNGSFNDTQYEENCNNKLINNRRYWNSI